MTQFWDYMCFADIPCTVGIALLAAVSQIGDIWALEVMLRCNMKLFVWNSAWQKKWSLNRHTLPCNENGIAMCAKERKAEAHYAVICTRLNTIINFTAMSYPCRCGCKCPQQLSKRSWGSEFGDVLAILDPTLKPNPPCRLNLSNHDNPICRFHTDGWNRFR